MRNVQYTLCTEHFNKVKENISTPNIVILYQSTSLDHHHIRLREEATRIRASVGFSKRADFLRLHVAHGITHYPRRELEFGPKVLS